MQPKKKRFGERLIDQGIIDKLQLRAALAQQAQWGKSLGRTLLELRLVTEEQLIPVLADHLNVAPVDLPSIRLDKAALALVDEEFCRAHECIAFEYQEKGKFLHVAMADPQNLYLFDELRVLTRCNIRPFLAGPESIRNAIERAFIVVEQQDIKLQFELAENVFDFGDESADELVMDAQRPAPVTPARPAVPAVAAPPPARTGPATASWPAPAGPLRPVSTGPFRPSEAEPGEELPEDLERELGALEHQVAALESRLDGQELLSSEVVVKTREIFDQLAAMNLVELADDFPVPPPPAAPRSTGGETRPPRSAAPAARPPEEPWLPPLPRPASPPPAAEPAVADHDAQFVPGSGRLVEAPRRPAPQLVRPPAAPVEVEGALALLQLPADAASVVAMDLGTTRSSVAAVIDGRVSVLKLPGGEWDMPSVVGFMANGSVMVGRSARLMLANDPANAISSPKRLLGRRFDEPGLAPYLKQLGMKSTAGPHGDVVLESHGRKMAVTEACAHILTLLRLAAERNLRRPVKDVILTVPVTAGELQIRAMTAAAQQANLRVIELLPEPVAAALACVSDPACQGLIAVYDFGGGTFDFSVVEAGETMRVIATAGDSWLGGDDFDDALANAAANAFWQQTKVELRNQAHHWQRLLLRAEAVKRELTQQEQATLRLPGAARTASGEVELVYPVTRDEFAALSWEIIQRSLETCHQALARHGINPTDLNVVYISGGTTYIPAVRTAVAEFFAQEPRVVIPPERMVVAGAAVHGALSAGRR